MRRTRWLPVGAALIVGSVAGCASRTVPAPAPTVVVEAPPPAPVAEEPPPNPIDQLIAESQKYFESGQAELELGHLVQAREEFDRALDVLLESTYGARIEPRLRDHFDQLVDRIAAYELSAIAKGDGFDEMRSEPASLDELLTLSSDGTVPAPDLEAAVRSDIDRTAHDVPIPVNAKVLQYVALFQGRLRDWFTAGLEASGQYLPMIQSVFRAEGLPLDLAYVPLIESAFKPNAVSRARARGIWQFMRPTGIENGLRQDWYFDERSDPEKATAAAAKYLRTLSRDVRGGLASGSGVLQRRAGPRPAGAAANAQEGLLVARPGAGAAPRDPRVRPDDPGGHRHREESGLLRVQSDTPASARLRAGHAAGRGRFEAAGGMDRRIGRRHSGAQSGASAVDDADRGPGLRGEDPGRNRRDGAPADGAGGRDGARRAQLARGQEG